MKRESWQVILSCAFGAGIGSLIALELWKPFWWIGMMIGFVVGYVAVEPMSVIRAIPSAWRAAREWKTPKLFWTTFFWGFLSFNIAMLYPVLLFVALSLAQQNLHLLSVIMLGIGLIDVTFVPIFFLFLAALSSSESSDVAMEMRQRQIKTYRDIIDFMVPHRVFFVYLPRAIWSIICEIPKQILITGSFLRRFSWELFIRIHSDKRLLCGTDALLGTAVGYFTGSAIIGAIAGGLFGLVNYEIVTERWLKPRGYVAVRS